MSRIAFLNIGMHGHVNPTLPVVAELVRRGHTVTYHTSAPFVAEIEAAGACVHVYPGVEEPVPEPPIPLTFLESLARSTLRLVPPVVDTLRDFGPDLVVHDSGCPWGPVVAQELHVPAVSMYTTFAFGRHVPSPTRASLGLLAAALRRPRRALGYLRARSELSSRYGAEVLPWIDLGNLPQAVNLVCTSRSLQPSGLYFDGSYRFVGPCVGARPADPSFRLDRLVDPVVYISLGTVFDARPDVLRQLALGVASWGGSVVVATGRTDPAALGSLPENVVARRTVPQLDVLSRAALFITHGGMNSVNEALLNGVPLLVVPQGADQPAVAARVTELYAGLTLRPHQVSEGAVRSMASRLLVDPHFRAEASRLGVAQREAGGYVRAADEIECSLATVGPRSQVPVHESSGE